MIEFCIETLYPDYWNIKNNIPDGLWLKRYTRLRDHVPLLTLFCIVYLKLKCPKPRREVKG